MRNLLVLIMLFITTPAFATPFVITGGTFFDGSFGGIRYNVFGENFAASGNDTIGFGATVNGVAFSHNDLFRTAPLVFDAILSQEDNRTLRPFSFEGVLTVGNTGELPQSFSLIGAGLASIESFGSGLINTTLAFAPTLSNVGAPIPEPSTWLLFVTGLIGFGAWRQRRRFFRKQSVFLIPWS